ncbi:odorant receptor 94a-like [Ptiloglossa arizonensis]|uniref:odorant receptor 94a-like n=1 Tax=Ptiloglossa arizonensis TaxID=3350558 RepID=UPI003FA11ED3
MHILRKVFTLLTICGCSRPATWSSPFKKFLYNVYTICVFVIMHTLVVSQILDLVFNVENEDDFSENFYVTLVMIITCFKMSSLLLTQKHISVLVNTLEGGPFLPIDIEEKEIRKRFNDITQWNTMAYTFLTEGCMAWIFVTSLFVEYGNKKLTFRAWLPFDYSSPLKFSFVYAHQALSAFICCLSNVACDSLFSGLLVHIYCQFEILGYRLRNIQRDETDSVKQCAHHHNHIYKLVFQFRSVKKHRSRFDTITDTRLTRAYTISLQNYCRFATMVNEEFKVIVFIQFATSTSTICFDLFRLTQRELGSEIVDVILYASCTLMQIFYYCWYGNEVKLKSLTVSNMVFESDWTTLNNKTKKILLMIMRRATVPIQFSSLYFVSVNLESFKTLLKTSYSAYNLFQ